VGGGRELTEDMVLPSGQILMKGDRLEPSSELPDVALLDEHATSVRGVIWRTTDDQLTNHRCPLFDEHLGIGLQSLAVDVMHSLNLGVMQEFVAWVFQSVITQNAYGIMPSMSAAERTHISVQRLLSDILRWYTSHADRDFTRISNLTLKMLGSKLKPRCKTKAAETEGLVFFSVWLLEQHAARLAFGKVLLDAGQRLTSLVIMLRSCPAMPAPTMVQDMLDTYRMHCSLMREVGAPFKPKHHSSIHLIARQVVSGAARLSATWYDESLNRKAKQAAATCHAGSSWYRRFASRMEWLLGREGVSARLRSKKKESTTCCSPPLYICISKSAWVYNGVSVE